MILAETNIVLTSSAEGKFSMYIDAMKNRMAKSSYIPENEYVDLQDKNRRVMEERILKEFVRW